MGIKNHFTREHFVASGLSVKITNLFPRNDPTGWQGFDRFDFQAHYERVDDEFILNLIPIPPVKEVQNNI
jgi:hypothetical protein